LELSQKPPPDTLLSLSNDSITPVYPNQSIAESLLTTVGEPNFELIRQFVDDFVTVSELEIAWFTLRLKRLGLTVETSEAVALAACMFL
jgi:threonine dehydratase